MSGERYTVHHTGVPGAWRGIIKRDGVEVWRSADTFRNRDETTYHLAARAVAGNIVAFLNLSAEAREARLSELDQHDLIRAKNGMRVAPNASQYRRWCKERADAIEASSPHSEPEVAGNGRER